MIALMETNVVSPRYWLRADRLLDLLETQGRRKSWLARQAGHHPSMISHAIAGRTTVSAVAAERMATALGVPFSLLFEVSADTDSVSAGEAAA